MKSDARIYVAGHTGLVGSAIARALSQGGFTNLVVRRHSDLDLTDQSAVFQFFRSQRPEYVFVAAARVGGIMANHTYPANFIAENLSIAVNVISAAHESGVRKLLFLSSSCVYPKLAPQPMKEEYILTGPLEPTNEPYAVAKIAGMKLCESYHRQHGDNFFSVLPTNVYGPFDNFDLETSHVLPAMIRKFDDAASSGARRVELWGTGSPRREFIHSDDLADACVFLMQNYSGGAPVNIGVGTDLAIAELARVIAHAAGFEGEIVFDHRHPDGTPRKLLDVSRLAGMGWQARIPLVQGIRQTHAWYRQHVAINV